MVCQESLSIILSRFYDSSEEEFVTGKRASWQEVEDDENASQPEEDKVAEYEKYKDLFQ